MMDDLAKATSSNFNFDSMTDVLTGDLPSIGSHNTESKFQHHFNSQRPSSSSSITYQNSPFTLQSSTRMGNLSVEAKAFKPIKGQQPPMQPVGMQQLQFTGMPLDSDNQSMHMPLHVNPSAREFVPRMTSAPTLNQQPSLKPPLNGSYNSTIREYMPKSGRPNDIQSAPFYPPGTNFPSLPTNMGPRSDVSLTSSTNTRSHQQQQLPTNNMVEYMQDIPVPAMDPRQMPTSIYQSQSTNNSNYYSDGNSQPNPLNGGYSPAVPGTFNSRQQQQRPQLFSGDSSFISSNTPTITGRSSPTTLGRRLVASAAAPATHHTSAASMVSSNSHPELAEISGMNKQLNADSPHDRNKPVAHQNGGTTYFYPDSKMPGGRNMRGMVPHSVQFPGTPAHLEYLPKKAGASFFMGTELRQEYNRRHELTMAQLNPEDELHAGIPIAVECYLHLYPLEPPQQANTLQKLALCYMSSCYKAFKEKDGKAYFMRRIHCFRQFNEKSMVYVDLWKKLHHANIVQLREVFTTKAFGELSMMFVHDFHAGSETLLTRHFRQNTYSKNKWPGARGGVTHETLIWSYVVQLTAALRNIHANNLACRVMDLSKIIVTDKSRIRISGVGILDVLTYDSNNSPAQIQQYQQEDLIALGKIVLCLAVNSLNVNFNQQPVAKYVEMLNPNYSSDLKNLIMYLLVPQAQGRILSVNEIMPMIGARFYTQLDTTLLRCDIIENELEKEMENGRLYRLLAKLGVVNERPEFGNDQRWSETGDRYLLKLFRDYVFHQVTETGEPFIDLAHVTSCLNKLDAGTGEKVCLMSRDEQNVLVVSYGELKRAISKCFSELLQSSISSSR